MQPCKKPNLMSDFYEKMSFSYFSTLNVQQNEVFNMFVLYYNNIRIVWYHNFWIKPTNWKYLKCPCLTFLFATPIFKWFFFEILAWQKTLKNFFCQFIIKATPKKFIWHKIRKVIFSWKSNTFCNRPSTESLSLQI